MASTQELKSMIYAFRVSELQELIQFAGRNKNGKKKELQTRALDLLKPGSEYMRRKILELHNKRFNSVGVASTSQADPPRTRQSTSASQSVQQERGVVELRSSTMGGRGGDSGASSSLHRSSGVNYAGSTMTYGAHHVKNSSSLIEPGPSGQTRALYPYHPDIEFRDLPFFDVLYVLLQPSSLIPTSNSGYQETHFQFHLSPQQVQDIMTSRVYSSVTNSSVEHTVQIQLRFCVLESSCEQDDNFPPSICVKINGRTCSLPNPVPTNRPGVEPKRPGRPVNITHLCRMSATTSNNLSVSWASDFNNRAYVCAVFLVRHLDSTILLSRLRSKGMRNPDHTRGMIKEKLEQSFDSEITTTSLRGSLMCPIGKMKMQIPCRPVTCKHLQCFDASLFLKMNEKKPRWICPVCDNPATFSSLIIDGMFSEISAKAPSRCTEVQFHEDGTWTPIIEETEAHDVDNSFKEVESKPQKKRAEAEVVDLTVESDTEDDEDWSRPTTPFAPKPTKMFKTSANDMGSAMMFSGKMHAGPPFMSYPSQSSGSILPSYESIPGTSSSGMGINEGASTSSGSVAPYPLPHTLIPPAPTILPDIDPPNPRDMGYGSICNYGMPYMNPPYYTVPTPSPPPPQPSALVGPTPPPLASSGLPNPQLFNSDDMELYSLIKAANQGDEKPDDDNKGKSASSTPDIISLD